jgi:FKBP-type peptidyl-prolyl cis-trans isomerase 2
VELSNGNAAVVLEVGEEAIKLDANNVIAGKTLAFELEVLDIQRATE